MDEFEQKTIKSFQAAKADVEEFKRSMNEWVIFLDSSLRQIRQEVRYLSSRIAELESELDTMWRR